MNIRQHVIKSIYAGLPARIDVQVGAAGVRFADEDEFIPFFDLGYNADLGYFRLSAHPQAASECDSANPETIHLLAGAGQDSDNPMYVWADGDGGLHLLGEEWRCADLYAALGELLCNFRYDPEPISEHDDAWGRNYTIAQAVEEAIAYGYGTDPVQVADSIRAAARAGRIRGASQVAGRWSIPTTTLRGWLVRSAEEKRGRPRKAQRIELWQHRASGERYAVLTDRGRPTAASGPLDDADADKIMAGETDIYWDEEQADAINEQDEQAGDAAGTYRRVWPEPSA